MPEDYCVPAGKIGYPSKSAASHARAQFRRKFKRPNGQGDIQVFKCNTCGQWHLGRTHMRGRKRWSV